MPEFDTSVTCTFTFEAAHHLSWHPGKCSGVHGHSYRLDVTVAGPLDEHGVVVDFDELTNVVEATVVAELDHRDLNEVLDNPTAERIAAHAWGRLAAGGLTPSRLDLWETPGSRVTLVASAARS